MMSIRKTETSRKVSRDLTIAELQEFLAERFQRIEKRIDDGFANGEKRFANIESRLFVGNGEKPLFTRFELLEEMFTACRKQHQSGGKRIFQVFLTLLTVALTVTATKIFL